MRSGRSGWPGISCSEPRVVSGTRAAQARRYRTGGAAGRLASLVVVGAGAAGLFARSPPRAEGARVTLVSARPLAETASYWAQGGLAAALAARRLPRAAPRATRWPPAAGSCAAPPPRSCATRRPARFADLEALGVRFDADRHGRLALGLEGGHGIRRVVHAGGSATGRRILRQLSADVVEEPGIDVLEGRRVRALLAARDGRVRGRRLRRRARRSRRAPSSSPRAGRPRCGRARPTRRARTAPGLLLARAAGAELADLEFVAVPSRRRSSASPDARASSSREAVRGEGATLHDAAGERFVDELRAARRRRARDPPPADRAAARPPCTST